MIWGTFTSKQLLWMTEGAEFKEAKGQRGKETKIERLRKVQAYENVILIAQQLDQRTIQ